MMNVRRETDVDVAIGLGIGRRDGRGSNEKPTLVQCPYDKTHLVMEDKLFSHLTKCRHNYKIAIAMPGNNAPRIEVCRYSFKHHIPAKDLEQHENSCPVLLRLLEEQRRMNQMFDDLSILRADAEAEAEGNWGKKPKSKGPSGGAGCVAAIVAIAGDLGLECQWDYGKTVDAIPVPSAGEGEIEMELKDLKGSSRSRYSPPVPKQKFTLITKSSGFEFGLTKSEQQQHGLSQRLEHLQEYGKESEDEEESNFGSFGAQSRVPKRRSGSFMRFMGYGQEPLPEESETETDEKTTGGNK